MDRYIRPVNVIKTSGISKEQYAQMGTGEVMALVRTVYGLQATGSSIKSESSHKLGKD